MTEIRIALNIGTREATTVEQVAELVGVPTQIRDGVNLWVRVYFRNIQVTDVFPAEEWFDTLPGQNADLQFDQVDAFCDALASSAEVESDREDAETIRAELKSIAEAVGDDKQAHFTIALDY